MTHGTHTGHSGFPSVAQDYFSSDFSFDTNVITHPDTSFIMRVHGHAMEKTGIFHNDLLIVDRSIPPQSGDVIITVIDDELAVRRLTQDHDNNPLLVADDPHIAPQRLYFDNDFTIWGVAIGSYHPLLHTGQTL